MSHPGTFCPNNRFRREYRHLLQVRSKCPSRAVGPHSHDVGRSARYIAVAGVAKNRASTYGAGMVPNGALWLIVHRSYLAVLKLRSRFLRSIAEKRQMQFLRSRTRTSGSITSLGNRNMPSGQGKCPLVGGDEAPKCLLAPRMSVPAVAGAACLARNPVRTEGRVFQLGGGA